jgi:hypothetical protein
MANKARAMGYPYMSCPTCLEANYMGIHACIWKDR